MHSWEVIGAPVLIAITVSSTEFQNILTASHVKMYMLYVNQYKTGYAGCFAARTGQHVGGERWPLHSSEGCNCAETSARHNGEQLGTTVGGVSYALVFISII